MIPHPADALALDPDTERLYDNRAAVADSAERVDAWARAAAEARANVRHEAGVPYGNGERARYDLFPAENVDAPVALFVHGGYWRALDRSSFSHVGASLARLGVTCAVPSYELCPNVTIGAIVEAMRAAALALHARFGRPLTVVGHSAGGHVAAWLACTNWRERNPDAPERLVAAAMGLSGVYDLAPLRRTSMNADLRLSAADAERWSPLRVSPPEGVPFDAVVGADETPAFVAQSRDLAAAWAAAPARYEALPGANHFTIVDRFAAPDSPLARRLAQGAHERARRAA